MNGQPMLPKWPNDGSSHSISGGTVKAEAAKVPGAGISPKPCPRKCVAEKGRRTALSDIGNRAEGVKSGPQWAKDGRRGHARYGPK
jgi:hypothetical protein